MTFWPFRGILGKAVLLLAGGFAEVVLGPLPLALGGPTECSVPDELMQIDEKLPHLAERLHANEPVKIVVIGGASTTGLAAGSSDLAYPIVYKRSLPAGILRFRSRSPIGVFRDKRRSKCWSGFQRT
jgi:hypothetical protein